MRAAPLCHRLVRPCTNSWTRADAPYGMHHGDVGYDVHDPELTEGQRAIVEFSPEWSVSLHTTLLLPSPAAAAVASAAAAASGCAPILLHCCRKGTAHAATAAAGTMPVLVWSVMTSAPQPAAAYSRHLCHGRPGRGAPCSGTAATRPQLSSEESPVLCTYSQY